MEEGVLFFSTSKEAEEILILIEFMESVQFKF